MPIREERLVRGHSLQRRIETNIGVGLRAALALACWLGLAATAWAQTGAKQMGSAYRRHFIVLIDDSVSVAGRSRSGAGDKRRAISEDLPERLFGGIKGVPAFNPTRDRLSVLFFTILSSNRPCDKRKANSALPENIFDLAYTGEMPSKKEFADRLRGWMFDDCHFNGNWSPIVVSSLLALPYLQSRLPADELHSQTILIQVTDAEFNSQAKPGHELTEYRKARIADVPAADQLLKRVSELFSLNILPNQEALRGVFYLTAEYGSQRTPESAVQYQRNSLLYPQALSSAELRYRVNDQTAGDIQLLAQGKGAEFDFKPLWVRVGFQNEQGEDWRLGEETLPRLTEETKPVSLNPCEPPQCERGRDHDRISVGLFEAGLGRPLRVARSASDPEPGWIKFSVGFHYDTPIYNHLCVETPELTIKVDPAPPTEIPNLFLLPSRLGKADIADEWQPDDDGVTTQEEAKNRILARRNLRWLMLVIMLVVLAVLLMIYLFLKYYHRGFQPSLTWLAAPEVVVDFNRPAASRLLVGTLKIRNEQPVPWLGRLLRNEEQPTRQAEISLNYNYFQQSGLDLTDAHPIGFVRGEGTVAECEELDRTTHEAVSDGRQVYVFLAADKLQDYRADGGPATGAGADQDGARFTIPLKAQMHWGVQNAAASNSLPNRAQRWLRTHLAAEQSRSLAQDLVCSLLVKPEEPCKPYVTYTPSSAPRLYFEKDALVQVGSFWFESQALHEFAQPYRWEGYTIQSYQGNRPLSGEPIRLAQPAVEVAPGACVEVPVYIRCDGQTIPNPDPASCEYSFKLLGDFSAESEAGPYTTTLYRDPKRAEIELQLVQAKRRLEVFWSADDAWKLRTRPDGADANELLDDTGAVVLEPQTIRFDARTGGLRELLSFEIGNSCAVGGGVVEVDIRTDVRCAQAVRNSIQLGSDRALNDLLGVYDFKTPRSAAVVRAGDAAQTRAVYLHPGIISRIISARIEAEHLAAEIKLVVHVEDGQGATSQRTLTVVIPFSLEQLPGLNWMAIDFGTSAISAALGAGRGDSVMMIPLQDIAAQGGRSFAQYDNENPERGNRYLLPSWICCNADLRQKTGDRSRPGFPGYYSEHPSMTPGEPDFIGLPAVTHELAEHPGRVIYSLKSWLGKAAPDIPIQVKENGKEVQKLLPLEKMVESGFAALAEGYLFDPGYRAEQIVITHPNTFTPRHRDLLHRIVHTALGKPKRFGIPLPERIRLMSESDAVAYHYCMEQMRGQPRAGIERLLVYDFGAGTLDLSLIEVEWKQEPPRHPLRWKVERRLGVPVAGNYLDEILARLIHGLLTDAKIVDAQGFKYRLPVVGWALDKEQPDEHRRAIIRLWNWIREAKHKWSHACREVLDNGGGLADCPPLRIKVGVGRETEVVSYAPGQVPEVDEPTDEPGLWIEGMDEIYLSIPAQLIESDERMSKFVRFVTEEIIDEVLDGVGLSAGDVHTVIVSGRGARFPELRDKVWRRFPNAETPDLLTSNTMKDAVVLGAIARQSLSRVFTDASDDAALTPELGVLINYNDDLVLEKDWDKPIDLTASPTFRLVQVNLKTPNPREDKKSLRKHFYIDLTDREFVRDDVLGDDKHLYVRKEIRDGELALYLEGEDGWNRTPVFPEGQIAKTVATPPWPVGNVLLHPQE